MMPTKRLLIAIAIFLLLPSALFGQGRDMSEIKSKILQAQSEKEKIEGLIELGISYGRQFPDSTLYYRDSLRTDEFTSSELTEAGMLFLNAVATYNSGNLRQAVGELEVSAQKLKEAELLGPYYRNLNLLGIAYSRTREYQQAIDILSEVINESPDTEEFISAKAAAYSNISNSYKRLSEYAEAINALEESLILVESSDQERVPETLAFTYFNLAQMLLLLDEPDEALDTYKQIELDKVRGSSLTAAILGDMGQTYFKLKQYDSAKYYTEQSLNLAVNSRNPQQIIQPSILLSTILIESKSFEEALKILVRPITYCETNRCPPPAVIDLQIAKMEALKALGDLEAAKATGLEFRDYINANKIAHMSKDGFSVLATVYEGLNDKEEALYYQKLYADLNLVEIERNRALKEKSEMEQLKSLRAQRALEETQTKKDLYQYLTLQSVGISVFLLGVIIFGYRYFKKDNQKKDEALAQAKSSLEKEKRIVQEKIFLNLKSKAIVDIDDIIYITSDGPYIEIYQKNKEKPEIDRNTLKNILEDLPSTKFVQIHRSYIINIQFVKSLYASKVILTDETELNVSRTYKSEVQSKLKISA